MEQKQDDSSDREEEFDNYYLFQYIKYMPKVELHAHLNGCIREEILVQLAKERNIVLSSKYFALKSKHDISHQRNQQQQQQQQQQGEESQMYNIRPRSLSDCFDMFFEISKVITDLSALRKITYEALQDFAIHNVTYLELRSTPKRLLRSYHNSNNYNDTKQQEVATKREYIETIVSVMEEFELQDNNRYLDEEQKKGAKDTQSIPLRLPLITRLIISIDRSKSIQEAKENAQIAIDLFQQQQRQNKRSHYIVGMDFSGNPTKNDFADFESIFRSVRKAGLKITIHCGEVPVNDKYYREMDSILSFIPDRLGHGLLLSNEHRDQIQKKRIPLECCPTSNVMTLNLHNCNSGNDNDNDKGGSNSNSSEKNDNRHSLVHGLKRHPLLKHWYDNNKKTSSSSSNSSDYKYYNYYPISISTDDSGVFDTNPTKELYLAAKSWNLNYKQISNIVLDSIEHIFDTTTIDTADTDNNSNIKNEIDSVARNNHHKMKSKIETGENEKDNHDNKEMKVILKKRFEQQMEEIHSFVTSLSKVKIVLCETIS